MSVSTTGPEILVGKAIPAIQDFAKKAMPFINKAIDLAREKGQQFINWFKGTLVPAIQSVVETARSLWDRFGEDVKRNFKTVLNVIKHALNVVIGIVEFFAAVLRGDWSAAWAALKKIMVNAVQGLMAYLKGIVGNFKALGVALGNALKDGIVSGFHAVVGLLGNLARAAINAVISVIRAFGIPGIHIDPPGPGASPSRGFILSPASLL